MEVEIKDRLLNYFGVNSHKELTDYISKNPNNNKVLMLEEILAEWGIKIEDRLFEELI